MIDIENVQYITIQTRLHNLSSLNNGLAGLLQASHLLFLLNSNLKKIQIKDFGAFIKK